MFSWLNHSRFIYIFSNLLVIPATFLPKIDFISNLSFLISFLFLLRSNIFLALVVCIIFIIKNNANYRFELLLKIKGKEISKSDNECVYLFAWCTLLRYFLIGMASKEILYFLNNFLL